MRFVYFWFLKGAKVLDADMITLASKFATGKESSKTLTKALEEYVDRMDDQEALQRVTQKKNNNVAGEIYLPAIDYSNSMNLFAGELESKKIQFTILKSCMPRGLHEAYDSDDEDDEMEL